MPDFDASIRDALEGDPVFQGLLEQLREAASAEVTIRDAEPCPKRCGCKHIRNVKVPDYKLKLQIMEFLANRGVGRPGQTQELEQERITFVREVRK